jgi:hypothetical protein
MSYGRDKSRLRRNRARVREVLWRDWDPIGVNTSDCPKDEYDPHADRVYVMLMVERRSADEVEAYLYDVATQRLGLGKPTRLHSSDRHAAEILVRLRADFDAEPSQPR